MDNCEFLDMKHRAHILYVHACLSVMPRSVLIQHICDLYFDYSVNGGLNDTQ